MFGDKLKEIISKGKDENNSNDSNNTKKENSYSQADIKKEYLKEEAGIKKSNNSKKENNKSKRQIENLVFFIIIMVITVIIINSIWKGDTSKSDKTQTNTSSKTLASTTQNNTEETSSDDLEKKLESVLISIQGVEKVKVLINYSESIETVAMYNENSKTSETQETDTSGGVRTITQTDAQKEVVYKEENGDKTPITQKTISPKPEGAIVTVKGASNSVVKSNVIQAIEAVTGLATHKIQVFEMN